MTPPVTTPPGRLSLSLSGGGFRAMLFSAGALLAVADSSMRDKVSSVSSVSGGSIASAVSIGGFRQPPEGDVSMAERVSLLSDLAQSRRVSVEGWLRYLVVPGLLLLMLGVAAFAYPDISRSPFVLISTLGVAGLTLVVYLGAALLVSWYDVQGVVETLVDHVRGHRGTGTALASIADDEDVHRIFCATDLSTGLHAYFTPDTLLVSQKGQGTRPNVYLADVVAASARFPGLRPIVLPRVELGLEKTRPGAAPRLYRGIGRIAFGLIGLAGLALVIGAFAARLTGVAFLSGWIGAGLTVLVMAAGLGLIALGAWLLRSGDDLVLVDGGVTDNLGAAFTLLAGDPQYPRLPEIAGVGDAGLLLLVIDAGKPFRPLDSGRFQWTSLIPLRLRGAQRAILSLFGAANASARVNAIRALSGTGGTVARMVSLTTVPEMEKGDRDFLAGRGAVTKDWWRNEVANRTSATRTTLSALTQDAVFALVLQSYRLTQTALAELGVTMRQRSAQEIFALISPTRDPQATAARLVSPSLRSQVRGTIDGLFVRKDLGPYGRLMAGSQVAAAAIVVLVIIALGAWVIVGPMLFPFSPG